MSKPTTKPMTGTERIAAERQRQINAEGWTAEHDDDHTYGELALVAALYATPVRLLKPIPQPDGGMYFAEPWPNTWGYEWDKRARDRRAELRPAEVLSTKRRIRDLEKAGALLAAEIDRLLRLEEGEAT